MAYTFSGVCNVCGNAFTATVRYRSEARRTCSRQCAGSIGGNTPTKGTCACGQPAVSRRGRCRGCVQETLKAKKRRHYQRHRDEVLAKVRARQAALTPEQRKAKAAATRDRLQFNGQREAAKERDRHTCQRCGSSKQLVVHHLKPRAHGKANDAVSTIDDLVTLCRSCHVKVHPPKRSERMAVQRSL